MGIRVVAIVDDDADDSEVLATALKLYEDVSILTFDDSQVFLEFLKSAPTVPDLIVTDMYMPKISGAEVIAFLKSEETTQSIPVVMLSTIDANRLDIAGVYVMVKPHAIIEYDILAENILKLL